MQEKHLISVPKYRDHIITWIHGPLLFCGIFNKDIPFILTVCLIPPNQY